MYFHGVKSTAHPPIIGLLGHSTDSVVKQRCCLRRVLITTLGGGGGVSGPPAVAVPGIAPAADSEVIFKGFSFNNVGPIVGAVQGVSILRY